MDCIFCKIAKKEIASEMLYEDDDVYVFNDIHPKAPVHLLIIPKTHIQSVAHLEEGHGALVGKLVLTAKAMALEKGLAGYKLIVNVGREGGQVVDHLHLHLLGGWGSEDPNAFKV